MITNFKLQCVTTLFLSSLLINTAVLAASFEGDATRRHDTGAFAAEKEERSSVARPVREPRATHPDARYMREDRSDQNRNRGFFKRQNRSERGGFFSSRSEAVAETPNFSTPPKQIALLLPLSGPHADAAKAVREGFLSAYYENPQTGIPKPTVRVYDTLKGEDVQRIYHQAITDGADFVVGPLSKDEVAQLSALSRSELTVPVLALNQPPANQTSARLIQFALAPEEEAAQIAFKAHLQGYQTASIIVPDNGWGRRIADAFNAQWVHSGGRVLRTVYVDPLQDQAAGVRRLLGMNEVQSEAEQKKLTLKAKDVDVILMAAPPELARQWKPLFDFYYAETVPVYAISSIYTGIPDPKRDRDMNGVIFCDMPSLIKPELHAKWLNTSPHEEDASDDYVRLFALGVDAYRISQQMNHLTSNAKARYAGATGDLTLDDQYRIRRQLACAKFKDGKPTPYP